MISFYQKSLRLWGVLFLLGSLSGCVYFVVGGVGAVGGYIVSPDTVEGVTEHSEEEVWDAAVEVAGVMGTVEEENQEGGALIAKINSAKVIISLAPINKSTTRISIKARRSFLPKVKLAQEIFVKVVEYLND